VAKNQKQPPQWAIRMRRCGGATFGRPDRHRRIRQVDLRVARVLSAEKCPGRKSSSSLRSASAAT
jgi:hypothetical protein